MKKWILSLAVLVLVYNLTNIGFLLSGAVTPNSLLRRTLSSAPAVHLHGQTLMYEGTSGPANYLEAGKSDEGYQLYAFGAPAPYYFVQYKGKMYQYSFPGSPIGMR
ncbi:MAG: hypothetical protein ACXVP5_03480 [Tumebacillaceae bacterium]